MLSHHTERPLRRLAKWGDDGAPIVFIGIGDMQSGAVVRLCELDDEPETHRP